VRRLPRKVSIHIPDATLATDERAARLAPRVVDLLAGR